MKKNLLFILAFFAANFVQAQAPANDNCADAQPIALNDVLEYSTLEATTDGPVHPDATCFGMNDSIPKDIWFVFTPETADVVIVSNCGTSGTFDSRMVIYQAGADCTVGPDDFLACNDDGSGLDCGVASSIGFIPEAGATYLIRLGGFADEDTEATSGEGTITITVANGPDNDFCAAAIPVMLGAGQEYSTLDALTDGPDHLDNPCFGFGSTTAGADIWYTFTADFTGAVQWSTCNTGGFDTRLAVYNPGSACPPLDEDLYSCNDDGADCAGFTSDLLFEVVAGETYLLRLGGFGGDSGQGSFDLLETTPPVPPVNDACADVIDVDVNPPSVGAALTNLSLGTTTDATFVSDGFVFPPCLGNQNGGEFGDVWYRFNTMGLETVTMELYNLDDGETVAFYMNLMTDCTTLVDTMAIQGSCLTVNNTEDFASTTVTGLPEEPTDMYVRILTRLTSDAPGDYAFQIIGGEDPSSIEDEIFGSNVSIAPNPAQNEAVLRLNLQETAPLSIEIMNTIGQVVSKQDHTRLASGQHAISLDIADLATGIYFVNLRSENSLKTMKLVKE